MKRRHKAKLFAHNKITIYNEILHTPIFGITSLRINMNRQGAIVALSKWL